MAIKSGLRYWLVCDVCGTEHDDDYVYPTKEDALNDCDCDWLLSKSHLCPDCQTKQSTRIRTHRVLSSWRGHSIYLDVEEQQRFDPQDPDISGWRYSADDILVKDDPHRKCGYCGLANTPGGHDACLGELPGVVNACCGHGFRADAYVQFENGVILQGFDSI